MPRDYRFYLTDILACAAKVRIYVGSLTYEQLKGIRKQDVLEGD